MGLKKYGICICHDKFNPINSKGLCPIGAKERHKKSAESKGLTAKEKENDEELRKSRSQGTSIYPLRGRLRTKEPKTSKSFGSILQQKLERENEASVLKAEKTKKYPLKKTKIKPVSKDKAIELSRLAQIKKRKISLQGKNCELCGKSGEVDLFHIIGVGDKRFATDERNLLLSCRDCHNSWTINDWARIVNFSNFNEIMERLRSMDEGKYWKLKHKIDKYHGNLQIS